MGIIGVTLLTACRERRQEEEEGNKSSKEETQGMTRVIFSRDGSGGRVTSAHGVHVAVERILECFSGHNSILSHISRLLYNAKLRDFCQWISRIYFFGAALLVFRSRVTNAGI